MMTPEVLAVKDKYGRLHIINPIFRQYLAFDNLKIGYLKIGYLKIGYLKIGYLKIGYLKIGYLRYHKG